MPERLAEPRLVRKPSRIFVCSMSDLFNEKVTREVHEEVFAVMDRLPRHTFILLTKRPERLVQALGGREVPANWWLGVTAENQARLDERWPVLASIPAAIGAVRFVSVEPMLGSVMLPWQSSVPYPSWVICGPENGPGARRCDSFWIGELQFHCRFHNMPFFDKRPGALVRMMPGEGWS